MYHRDSDHLWVLENRRHNFKTLVERAVVAHAKRFQTLPNICYANPDDFDPTVGSLEGLIAVFGTYTMPRGCLWLGVQNKFGGLSVRAADKTESENTDEPEQSV